jgi:hypothetical protein
MTLWLIKSIEHDSLHVYESARCNIFLTLQLINTVSPISYLILKNSPRATPRQKPFLMLFSYFPRQVVASNESLLIPCRPLVTASCSRKGENPIGSKVYYTTDADVATQLVKRSIMPLSLKIQAFVIYTLDFDLPAITTLPSAIIKVSCKDDDRNIQCGCRDICSGKPVNSGICSMSSSLRLSFTRAELFNSDYFSAESNIAIVAIARAPTAKEHRSTKYMQQRGVFIYRPSQCFMLFETAYHTARPNVVQDITNTGGIPKSHYQDPKSPS